MPPVGSRRRRGSISSPRRRSDGAAARQRSRMRAALPGIRPEPRWRRSTAPSSRPGARTRAAATHQAAVGPIGPSPPERVARDGARFAREPALRRERGLSAPRERAGGCPPPDRASTPADPPRAARRAPPDRSSRRCGSAAATPTNGPAALRPLEPTSGRGRTGTRLPRRCDPTQRGVAAGSHHLARSPGQEDPGDSARAVESPERGALPPGEDGPGALAIGAVSRDEPLRPIDGEAARPPRAPFDVIGRFAGLDHRDRDVDERLDRRDRLDRPVGIDRRRPAQSRRRDGLTPLSRTLDRDAARHPNEPSGRSRPSVGTPRPPGAGRRGRAPPPRPSSPPAGRRGSIASRWISGDALPSPSFATMAARRAASGDPAPARPDQPEPRPSRLRPTRPPAPGLIRSSRPSGRQWPGAATIRPSAATANDTVGPTRLRSNAEVRLGPAQRARRRSVPATRGSGRTSQPGTREVASESCEAFVQQTAAASPSPPRDHGRRAPHLRRRTSRDWRGCLRRRPRPRTAAKPSTSRSPGSSATSSVRSRGRVAASIAIV